MANKINRTLNHFLYRFNPNWKFNVSSSNETQKLNKWHDFIFEADRESIEKVNKSIVNLLLENQSYELSLIAHGSSTYGKRNYGDIDLILEPSNGQMEMYAQLWEKLRKEFSVELEGGFCLDRNWILEFNQAQLYPPQRKAKPIQIGYRTNIFKEEYADTLKGHDLVQLMKRLGKPYVALILDNNPVRST